MNIASILSLATPSPKNRLLLIILGVTGTLTMLVVLAAPKPDKKPAEETAWPVTVIEAKEESLSPEITLYGRVETPRTSTLTSSVNAYVEIVAVREGDWVQEGDILVQLDNVDASLLMERRQADFIEANANLSSMLLKGNDDKKILAEEQKLYALFEKRVARYKKLRKDRSISEEALNAVLMETLQRSIALKRQQGLVENTEHQFSRAKANLKRATALLNEARIQFQRTSILAPFSGRITRVSVSPGELVTPGTYLTEMYDEEDLEIRAQIPALFLSSIKGNLRNGIALEAEIHLRDSKIKARLHRLSGKVDIGHSGVDGLFRLMERDAIVELGRAVNINLKLPALNKAIKVPIQSIYGNNRVFVVENHRLKGVDVIRIGELRDQGGSHHILIHSNDVTTGTRVLTSQLSNAISGLKVMIREPAAPQIAQLPVVDAKNG